MKKWIVITAIFAVLGYFILRYNSEKKEQEKFRQQIEYEKFKKELEDFSKPSEWLKEALDYEDDLRKLYFQLGYDEKRANDSVIAIQDRMYITKFKSDEEIKWYKEEHRPYLEKYNEEKNK